MFRNQGSNPPTSQTSKQASGEGLPSPPRCHGSLGRLFLLVCSGPHWPFQKCFKQTLSKHFRFQPHRITEYMHSDEGVINFSDREVWLAGWLANWSAGWSAGWLAGWLAGWMPGGCTGLTSDYQRWYAGCDEVCLFKVQKAAPELKNSHLQRKEMPGSITGHGPSPRRPGATPCRGRLCCGCRGRGPASPRLSSGSPLSGVLAP